MTEQEQIEKWKSEFEDLTGATRHPHQDRYFGHGVETMWQRFLMAKLNVPVTELPSPDFTYSGKVNFSESADIKCTIKGD